jgi:site-specific DNA-adenine methylase
MTLRPFFPYYGSKWSLAKRYPAPRYDRIIEPFAGSACYSLHHHTRDVVLVERDPVIAELWRYLLRVTPEEILALPDLEPGQSTDDLDVEPAARSLIRHFLGSGKNHGNKRRTNWWEGGGVTWGSRARARVAKQLEAIRHWTIVEGDGPAQTIHGEATWHVDPPYAGRPGSHYRHGSKGIDYEQLGAWCRHLPGQVMVCEQLGADWLPFERLGRVNGQRGQSTEVVWYSDKRDSMAWRQPELWQ